MTIVGEVKAADLPAVVRDAIHAAPGDEVTVTVCDDGSVGLYGPATPVPEDDSWLDTPYWQAAMSAAADDLHEGRTRVFLSEGEFFAAIKG